MIDLHCHLLPGIDDGPASLPEALELARAQVDAGVRTVACTPHVDWGMPNTAFEIAAGVETLRSALAEAHVPLKIVAAGEVGLTRAIELPDEELERLRIGGGRWLLLEAPLSVSEGVEQAVGAILMRGHRVLLAHPERCPAFQREPDALERLVAGGVICQVTAGALTGAFGSTVRRCADILMRAGLVHVVASDAHDATRRPPGLREQIIEAGYPERVELLTEQIPAAVLSGDRIPALPAPLPSARRRWFRRG